MTDSRPSPESETSRTPPPTQTIDPIQPATAGSRSVTDPRTWRTYGASAAVTYTHVSPFVPLRVTKPAVARSSPADSVNAGVRAYWTSAASTQHATAIRYALVLFRSGIRLRTAPAITSGISGTSANNTPVTPRRVRMVTARPTSAAIATPSSSSHGRTVRTQTTMQNMTKVATPQ